MSLVLFGHPFSSYTQKVLIALYENGSPFEFRCIAPDQPQHSAEWLRRWPLRKFPLLVDGAHNIAETSIIIEYLQLVHPGLVRLLPADPVAALDVRFLDRFFDLHVARRSRWRTAQPRRHCFTQTGCIASPIPGLEPESATAE